MDEIAIVLLPGLESTGRRFERFLRGAIEHFARAIAECPTTPTLPSFVEPSDQARS